MIDMQSEIFASNLRSRRRELGLTQRELADMIGYSEKSVSKWESGLAIAPSAVLPLLAKKLEMSIDSLLSESAEERYFLGIDGGGTKTEFALADASGAVIGRAILDGCNPIDVGLERTFEILSKGISAVCSSVPNTKISVFAGISGGITGDNKERIRNFLERYNFKSVANGSDAENAVALALGDKDGTAVIIGTGSIAFSRIGSELRRMGGYGYLLDDGGSGFAIGRDAVIAALHAEEGRGEGTMLLPLLKRELAAEKLIDALGMLYSGGKRRVASLTPWVFEAYKSGDSAATRILDENMRAIAELITAAPIGKDGKKRAVLVGGLTNEAGILFPLIKKHLKHAEGYDITASTKAPIYGALMLSGAPIGKEK